MARSNGSVEALGDRPGDGEGDEHDEADNVYRIVPDGEPVAGAQGLGDNFAEKEDDGNREEEGHERGRQPVHDHREGLHGSGIAEDEGDKEAVGVLHEGLDGLGVALLRRVGATDHHGDVLHVQGEETQREAAHQARNEDEKDRRGDVDPATQISGVRRGRTKGTQGRGGVLLDKCARVGRSPVAAMLGISRRTLMAAEFADKGRTSLCKTLTKTQPRNQGRTGGPPCHSHRIWLGEYYCKRSRDGVIYVDSQYALSSSTNKLYTT